MKTTSYRTKMSSSSADPVQNGSLGGQAGGSDSSLSSSEPNNRDPERGSRDSDRGGWRRFKYLIVVIILAAVLIPAGWFAGRYVLDYKTANFGKAYTLYVYPGMPPAQVIDSIAAGARVTNLGSLERCASRGNLAGRMKPGKYRIDTTHTSIYVIRMICNGWQQPHNLTLSGTIRTKGSIAEKIGRQMMTDSLTVDSLLRDTAFLSTLGFTPENVFALFLPDTYQMYWTDPAEKILTRFKQEYDRFWTQERLDKADAQGLDRMEVAVLASIVSGETTNASEYPVIARVYLNRLHKGMLLQADPTVAYCFDYKLDRILTKHTQVDSPYNTYKYAGLPPTPINVPPKACIEAALNPDNNNYLYFCASPDLDGTHRFAVTHSEHIRNANAFHKALNKRRAQAAK